MICILSSWFPSTFPQNSTILVGIRGYFTHHICNFIFLPSRSIVRILKSIPENIFDYNEISFNQSPDWITMWRDFRLNFVSTSDSISTALPTQLRQHLRLNFDMTSNSISTALATQFRHDFQLNFDMTSNSISTWLLTQFRLNFDMTSDSISTQFRHDFRINYDMTSDLTQLRHDFWLNLWTGFMTQFSTWLPGLTLPTIFHANPKPAFKMSMWDGFRYNPCSELFMWASNFSLNIPPSGVLTLGPQSLRECPWVGKKLKLMSLGS